MKIKIDRREFITERYLGEIGEAELEDECKAYNIKPENLTLERCAEVINTGDVDATVKTEDGKDINIYDLVADAVRNVAWDWCAVSSDVEDATEEVFVDWED